MTTPPPPGWYPDPSGSAGRRYWDGDKWGPTEPSPSTTPPGWYPDPIVFGGRRYWDGVAWGPVEPAVAAITEGTEVSDTSATVPSEQYDSAAVMPLASAEQTVSGVSRPPSVDAPPPVSLWWSKASRKKKVIAGTAFATTVIAALWGISYAGQQSNACSPAAPNSTRNDFVEENVLKDSLSDTWNKSGGIGDEVRDGDLAFVVSAIDVCNDGYARVAMTVTNTDNIATTFNPEYQRLMRNNPPQTGTVPKGGFECQLCDGIGDRVRINPGDSIATVVPFAIKGDPAIMAVELHDSSASFGVKVYP
jgi:hypothetical protein